MTAGHAAVDTRLRSAGVNVERLPLSDGIDLRSPLPLARRLRRLTAAGEPVIIHTHNFHTARTAALAAILSRRPRRLVRIVCTRHLARPGKRGPIYRLLYSRIDAVVAVSRFVADRFLSSRPPVDPAKVTVIQNALSPDVAREIPRPEAPSDTPAILYVGRVVPEKGLDTLFDALARLEDLPWTMTIAGTGPEAYMARLKRQAEDLGIAPRLRWEGYAADIRPLLAAADIGVAPSLAPEAFGLTLVEYMHAALAIVATDSGAQSEVTAGTALLVPPADAAALADSLRRLIASPDEARRLGRAAKRRAGERFSFSRLEKETGLLYRSLL